MDDGYGHVLKEQNVTFAVKYKDGTAVDVAKVRLSAGQATTNDNGVASVILTSDDATDAGNPLVVTASITLTGNNPHEASVYVAFTADTQTGQASLMVDSQDDKVADGTASYVLTATVVDNKGNEVPDTPVAFNLPSGLVPATGEHALMRTDNNG